MSIESKNLRFMRNGGAKMEKKKKILAIVLSIVMIMTSTSFAFATVEDAYEEDLGYVSKTISFSSKNTSIKNIANNTNKYAREINATADTVQERYEATKAFVESLDYGEAVDVKIAVLEDLESIREAGAEIEEYTVFIPKAEASLSQLKKLGSKNGYDFYWKKLSEKTVNIIKTNETTKSKIKNYISGVVDIVFCFVSSTISVPYSVTKSLLNLPSSVTVTDCSEVESVIKLTSTVREIYVQDILMQYGNNPNAYVRIYSGDSGVARPFIRIGFSTSSGIPEKSNWVASGKKCQTDNYNDIDQFVQIYNYGGEATEKLIKKVIKDATISWK